MSRQDPNKIERERAFHNQVFSDDSRKKAWRFYSAALSANNFYKNHVLSMAEGRVLEYGCGRDTLAVPLARKGQSVTGIDISDKAIDLSRQAAREAGVSERTDFIRMNAEDLSFRSHSFDMVYGRSIIHHLETETSYREISRVLAAGGKAIFLEPLGHNPLIGAYRKWTPALRSEDEHPLLRSDLDLATQYFSKIDLEFFSLLNLAGPVLSKPGLVAPLEKVDGLLLSSRSPLRWWAWMVVMTLEK